MSNNTRTDFEAKKSLGALYTGGPVEWRNGLLFTTLGGAINIVKDGSVLHKLEEEEDECLIFTTYLHNDAITLIVAHKSSLLRQYIMKEENEWKPEIVKTFRSIHVGPIAIMKMHVVEDSKLLATGGSDGTLKIWDLDHQYYTHNFKTGAGVCTVIKFHPTKFMVFGGFVTGPLYCWDLMTSSEVHKFQAGHFSAVTGLQILLGKEKLISAGRDKVAIVWNLITGEKVKTVPVSGSVEGLHGLNDLEVILAMEDKLVKWDLNVPKKLEEMSLGSQITKIQSEGDKIHCATADQNLVEISSSDFSIVNTVVGNNDEILCTTFLGEGDSHLLVGCNSSLLRLYKMSDYSCQLVSGHSDTVMCSTTSASDRNTVATGGKDKSIKIWKLDSESGNLACLVTGAGHSDPVHGISFLNHSVTRVISVSKDTTIKSWSVDYEKKQMSSLRTEIGHEKEISCCCVSPGDELVATGGQDKLCKVWDKELNLVNTLRGHKRGILSAQFSPQDQLLATGSGDAIIKIWNLTDFICVKQLEGQECSVLSLTWISGTQIISSGSDGLIKVWLVPKQEGLATLDSHSDKVWTISSRVVEGEIEIVSGSAVGELVFWKDITESSKAKKQDEEVKLILNQQKLSNLIAAKRYSEALKTALRLSQPFTALKLLKKIEYADIQEAVLDLDMVELDQLLGYTVKWNSNSKHSEAAQSVLHVILTNFKPDDLLKLSGCKDWVEGLLPYTEKHFERLSRLQMKSKFLVFLKANMKSTGLSIKQKEVTDEMEE